MLKLASKFAMDIFPSVIATILGAYIVNHYINIRPPAAELPAAASAADPKKAASKADSKPAEKSADLGNTPEPGVRARGISEKSVTDKSAADKAVVTPAEKADRPAETASIPPVAPADTRRHQPTQRDKSASKAPAPAPAAEPAVAAPVTAPPAEAAAVPDANDLARAAIERLRGADPAPHTQDSARAPEPPKVVEPPHVAAAPTAPSPVAVPVVPAPSLQPLPPPILVSNPPVDSKPVARADDSLRPTPPADIPDPHAPLDLRADASVNQPAKRPSVADDVLQATKKLFNSVLPKPQEQ
ncbi:MAG: hypothetical protein ABSG88_13855 [Bradyrhizobium sp.]